MQSYCIYAEAFAGPFRPLRAPEPPFAHKTPPFTQVLFLFDAFYGTISLRKPSSLCSYKTESEAPMKKRILALLLAFSMMLSLLPVSALADTGGGIDFAAYASNGSLPNLVMDNNTGKPDVSQIEPESRGVYQGNGWMYNKNSDALMLKSGKYDFNYTFPGFSDSKHYDDCDHLNCVNVNHIFVQLDATIVGGMFNEQSLVNHGTVTNGLFKGTSVTNHGTLNCLFPPNSDNSKPTGIGTIECHSLTAADNSTVEVLLYSSTFGNTTTTYSEGTFYFTGTPTLEVKLSSNEEITCINGEKLYGGLTKPDWKGYQTFTPKAGEDVVLNREPYVTDLVMTTGGFPETTGREPIYDTDGTPIGYKGNGWKYENGTLTLESGEYDFTHTEPRNTASSRYGDSVKCNIVVEENAEITGGILAGNSLTNSGTVKDILFMGYWLTNNNGTLSCLLGPSVYDHPSFTRHTVTAVDGSQIYYTVNQQSTGNGKQLYFTGTPKFTVKLEDSDILCINGDKNYGGLRPSVVHGYYTFTPEQEEDIVLNREPYATDLVITEGGIPDSTNREPVYEDGKVVGYKGTGWKYKNDTLTLESGSYRFIHEDGDSTSFTTDNISCNVIVQNGVSVTGGYFFNQSLVNYGTIERAAIYHNLENHNTIRNSYISSNTDQIKNSGFMGDCLFSHRPSVFKTYSLSEVENYPISATLNGVSASIVQSEFYFTGTPTLKVQLAKDGDFKKVTYINGKKNYGGLKGDNPYHGYTFTVEKEEDILLNDSVSRDPAPAYTLTVTGGGLVNGKTSAVVEAGDKVCLTVGEMQEGMSFNYWDLPTALTKALTDQELTDKDFTFSNKVESLTFTMPDLSGYTEDKSFTIRLDIRPAELPDDDDGPSVLGTMATVAVGGAAAGILVWQGVSLGVDSYLQLSLPGGVPVPTNRRELVKLLWETAGKPDVVLPALYGDVSAEDGELQKATRWAIDNGLVKPADDSDASRFDPDRSVSKYEVARAWFKVQQMLK